MTLRPLAIAVLLAVVSAVGSNTAFAQDVEGLSARGEAPERIDILLPTPSTKGDEIDEVERRCAPSESMDDNANEIVVCGSPPDDAAFHYSGNAEAAEERYARETAFADVLRAPGVAGPGIFTGPPTVGGICGIGLNPCPPPVAYLIDFETLPDTPDDSDAERAARGLAPIADPDEERRELSEFERSELGLPPIPAQTDER